MNTKEFDRELDALIQKLFDENDDDFSVIEIISVLEKTKLAFMLMILDKRYERKKE